MFSIQIFFKVYTFDIAAKRGKSIRTTERYLKLARQFDIIKFPGAPKTGGYSITKTLKNRIERRSKQNISNQHHFNQTQSNKLQFKIMAKVSPNISSQIGNLSKKELEKLVIKAAAKDKSFHDYLLVNYFEKEFGEQDLFDEAKADLSHLFVKRYKGYAEEEKTGYMLGECGKRITEFSKVCKNKNLEADLILYVLEIPFSMGERSFGTCFTAFNFKTVLLVKRLINLVQTKMHEDYKIQYQTKVNNYLDTLHRSCNYLDYVAALPESI